MPPRRNNKNDGVPKGTSKAARTARRNREIAKIRTEEIVSGYSKNAPARSDGLWRDQMHHEDNGKFSSMIKGLEMNYISNIPVTESVAESINPEYFKDPFLVAKQSFDNSRNSPKFTKRNVFGNYKILTARDQEKENEKVALKNKTMFINHNILSDHINHTPRDSNKYTQSTIHPTNEIFDTRLKMNAKNRVGKGTSIMSGDVNKPKKYVVKMYDQEKIPYAGSSIDLSQPDLYRYDVNNSLSRNNPLIKCKPLAYY